MASESSVATALEAAGAWSNEAEFLGTSDGTCMVETTSNQLSGEFSFTFTEVTGTILGIVVTVNYASGDANDYVYATLIDSTSTNRQKTVAWAVETTQCGNTVERTVGASDDLWSGIWTAAWITSTDFRIFITARQSGKAGGSWRCDNVLCTVYYEEVADVEEVMVID